MEKLTPEDAAKVLGIIHRDGLPSENAGPDALTLDDELNYLHDRVKQTQATVLVLVGLMIAERIVYMVKAGRDARPA